MKWLAIDCSTDTAFVAIGEETCLGHRQQIGVRTHSQQLLNMIQQLLSEQRWHIQHLDAIIFGRGPGSFTGLRVACSVVQGLAFAHDLPVYPVSGLQSIAHHLRLGGETRPIVTAIDARMNELYWSYYPDMATELAVERVTSASDICFDDGPVILAGVGVEAYLPGFSEVTHSQFKDVLTIYPNLLAMVDLVQSQYVDPVNAADALPVYIRNQVTQGASGG